MNDYQVRIALRKLLLAESKQDAEVLILDEVGIGHGVSRIDVVVVSTLLHGFEIKSDRDNLNRLPAQIRHYNAVFDLITLVVGYRHAYEALQLIPNWWGVKLVEETNDGTINIQDARDPHTNPNLDIHQIVRFLWRDEALALLEGVNQAQGFRFKNRNDIYERVAEVVDLDSLRGHVRYQFKSRSNWRVVA